MKASRDIHVLNWSLISGNDDAESTNDSGREENAPNKGILFEDLVEKLLIAMFPRESWRRTKKSHDGKRDFVYPDDEYLPDQKWAECKNYHSNVSINVIAPTLIMGAIENINTIIFFSYSPLNENAIEGIVRYAESTGKTIRLFDGNLLESLICKYNRIAGIGECFPDSDFDAACMELKRRPLRVIKTIRDASGNKLASSRPLEMGEPFVIHLIVQNLCLNEIDYSISTAVSHFSPERYQHQTLPCAALREHTIYSQALVPGRLRYTVALNARQYASGEKIPRMRRSGEIIVTDEPYLFWSGEQALRAQKIAEDHLLAQCATPLFITAKSGYGKSTLIELLLHEERIRQKYSILSFNIELSRNACAKDALSQILGIHNGDATPREQEDDARNALAVLSSNYVESVDILAEAMLGLYKAERPYLIVIDDIQKLNRAYVELIQELDYRAKQQNKPICYLFALNESVSEIGRILARLNWDATYQNRKYDAIRLDGFCKADILAFIRQKYGLTGIERFFEDFDTTVSPIELHNFCVALKQKRTIAPTRFTEKGQIYQIVDDFRFEEAVNSILRVSRSLDEICDFFVGDDISAYVLKYLYLAGNIPPSMRKKYGRQINDLISFSVLKDANGQITFRHEEVRRKIGERLSYSGEDYTDIYNTAETSPEAKATCALCQLGKIRGGTTFLRNFFHSTAKIEQLQQRHELCCLIMDWLDGLAELHLTADALRFVRCSFEWLDREQGYAISLRFLEQMARAATTPSWDTDEESVEIMAYLFKKYFDRSITTRKYAPCTQAFSKYEAVFQKLRHISNSRRNYWMSHYMNRIAIIYDRQSAPLSPSIGQAKTYYKKAALYCKSAGMPPDLVFQLCVDEFNQHYVYLHDLTSEHIDNTYQKLSDLKCQAGLSSLSMSYHLLLLEYLQQSNGSLQQAPEAFLERVKHARQSNTSSFYKLKLYMLESYILMSLNHFSEAVAALTNARELAYKKGLRYFIYKMTYVEAWLRFFQEGGLMSGKTHSIFVLALEQMLDVYGASYSGLAREAFLIVQLVKATRLDAPDKLAPFIGQQSENVMLLLQAACKKSANDAYPQSDLLKMRSYFMYREIDLPIV